MKWNAAASTMFLLLGAASMAAAPTAPEPGVLTAKPAEGRYVEAEGRFLVPYTETIPGTNVKFDMIPVPGGEFLLGSPPSEAGRADDEGPQVRVVLEPFWIGKCEVTWAEYHAYMDMYAAFKQLQEAASREPGEPASAGGASGAEDLKLIRAHARDGKKANPQDLDGVTCPTPLYDPSFTYSVGEEPNRPAVTMTQFAARQYTKWLSGVAGREYRLPSEAEWEYAARAGTTTAFSFGDDDSKLEHYAWCETNGGSETHAVGTKEPNPWGIFDTYGNVAEWTLDEYKTDGYKSLGPGPIKASAAVQWPTKIFPRVIRGGCWYDPPNLCRSASRRKSEEDGWKLSDPNYPHSPWWYTDEPATGVGMRVVRPLAATSKQEQTRVWEPDVDRTRQDVKMRLDEGRGALGLPDPTLPAAVEAAKKSRQ